MFGSWALAYNRFNVRGTRFLALFVSVYRKIVVTKNDSSRRQGLIKADLVDVVYQRHGGLTRDEAAEVIDAIFGTLKSTLVDGRAVRIKNFGCFEVTDRASRRGVDPTNGKRITIPPRKGLQFRPARRLTTVVPSDRPVEK